MAKWSNDAVLDQALNYVKNNAGTISVCRQQPTTSAEATSTYMLAQTTVAPADFTVSDGDTSGRKVRVGAKSGVSVVNSGTATHIALTGGGSLLYVTTCTDHVLTAGDTVDIPIWDIEIADPS